MANESDVTLKVKADTKDATKDINKFSKDAESALTEVADGAQKSFKSLFSASSEGVLGFASSFASVGLVAGGVGFAIKEAFSAAESIAATAEEVNRVNIQFDFLVRKAGDFSGALRGSLSETNQGINDFEDVLGAANTALVNTSLTTAQVGKNFESARRLSVALGVDSLQAFEAINTAIASGNTRALRQVGLFVDATTAVDQYAKSIGLATRFLTDSQRETALFEAVQKKVSENFSNVDTQTLRVSESFKQFGTAAKDVGEAAAIGLTKIFGADIQILLGRFTSSLSDLGNTILAKYGNSTQAAGAQQELLSSSIKDTEETLRRLNIQLASAQQNAVGEVGLIQVQINAQQKKVESLKQEQRFQAELAAEESRRLESSAAANQKSAVDADANSKQRIELLNAQREAESKVRDQEIGNLDQKIALATTNEEFTKEFADRELLVQQQLADQKLLIDKQFFDLHLTGSQAHQQAIQNAQDQADLKRFNTAKAFGDKMTALRKQQEAKEIADRDTFLSTAATLQNAKNKELATIGKAAAITQIAIKTPPAVASSFEFGTKLGGPPLGFIFAGIAATAMAAQAAAIAGVPLATGITAVPPGFPNDTFAANLTSGERVVNVKQNEDLTAFLDKQSKENSSQGQVVSILDAMLNRLSNLENTIIVNIGNKEIVREVRDGLRAGRTLAV